MFFLINNTIKRLNNYLFSNATLVIIYNTFVLNGILWLFKK
jgi:hypothetical protein